MSQASALRHPWEYAYVSYLEGRAYGRSSSENEFGILERNVPLEQGDELLTGEGSFMEATFLSGIVVWMNAETLLGIDTIRPEPELEFVAGEVFLGYSEKSTPEILATVKTAPATLRITPNSLVKIVTDDFGALLIEVRQGKVNIQIENGSITLGEGKGVRVDADGDSLHTSSLGLPIADEFELWSMERFNQIKQSRPVSYLEEDLPGVSSLNDHGDWDYETSVASYVWRPRVSVSWRPYLSGYWLYHPRGVYWVSYEPWGWTPYHYGRWMRDSLGRWCWVPGYRYSPAWVTFISFGNFYAWAPIGFGSYPYYYRTGHFYHSSYYRYAYPFFIDCDSFVYAHKDCFYRQCSSSAHSRATHQPLQENDITNKDEITRISQPLKIIDNKVGKFRFFDKNPNRSQEFFKKIADRFRNHNPREKVRPIRAIVKDRMKTLPRMKTGHKTVEHVRDGAKSKNILTNISLREKFQKRRQDKRGSFNIIKLPKGELPKKKLVSLPKRKDSIAKVPKKVTYRKKIKPKITHARKNSIRVRRTLPQNKKIVLKGVRTYAGQRKATNTAIKRNTKMSKTKTFVGRRGSAKKGTISHRRNPARLSASYRRPVSGTQ
jgi:hypothetical protein